METRVYNLIEPYKVIEINKSITLKENWVVVKPKLGSVCHADLRYFTGNRRKESLQKKLPMALIHEGIGVVEYSESEKFTKGDRVIFVPNIPGRLISEQIDGECDKYSSNGCFMGSGYDGIAQSLVNHPDECLVKIPDNIDDEIALLAELSSVSISAVKCIKEILVNFKDGDKVAIFGDGPVGYMTACYLKHKFSISKENITVFGADKSKLDNFKFANTENVLEYDFDNSDDYKVIIECTGGKFSSSAINQAIKIASRKSHLVLMGVTEELVGINTRDVLEKGITLYGSSRSITEDFEEFVNLVNSSEDYKFDLSRILPDEKSEVKNAEEFSGVLNNATAPHWKKVVMEFKWEE